MSTQIDWLADASFARVTTHPPSRYDAPRARATDPETSVQAGERAREFAGRHSSAIFTWLADHPDGGTKDEIAKGTGIDAIAVARRIAELRATAGVYDSGERRATPTGRSACVWKVRT